MPKLKKILRTIFSPYVKIKLGNVVGSDGISRNEYYTLGVLWEIHIPGYYEIWYDGPIHHISLGLVSLYWHYEYIRLGERYDGWR